MAVDLGSGDVWMFKDREVVPIPPPDKWSEYASLPPGVKERSDIKPLYIIQPEGPSFTVDGWRVNWQRYQFRIGFTSREGVVLHQVGYKDEGSGALTGSGSIRPIAYRMSFAGGMRSRGVCRWVLSLGERRCFSRWRACCQRWSFHTAIPAIPITGRMRLMPVKTAWAVTQTACHLGVTVWVAFTILTVCLLTPLATQRSSPTPSACTKRMTGCPGSTRTGAMGTWRSVGLGAL
jgi:hypothetical protein